MLKEKKPGIYSVLQMPSDSPRNDVQSMVNQTYQSSRLVSAAALIVTTFGLEVVIETPEFLKSLMKPGEFLLGTEDPLADCNAIATVHNPIILSAEPNQTGPRNR